VLDTFYLFKHGNENIKLNDNSSFLVLETKQLHVDIVRETILIKALEQKALAKKCYLQR